MATKEIIIVGDQNKEILDFLERLRVAGSLVVQVGADQFTVSIKPSRITEKGRQFLSRGGPSDN